MKDDKLASGFMTWGQGYVAYNPSSRPIEELPLIYGFNSGERAGWYIGVLLTEDGHFLGRVLSSKEIYMPYDLGIIGRIRPEIHEGFRKRYPSGYRMSFVPRSALAKHVKLAEAFEKYAEARGVQVSSWED